MQTLEYIQSKIRELVSDEVSKSLSMGEEISKERMSCTLSLIYRRVHRNMINSLINIYLKGKCVDYNKVKCIKHLEEHKETSFYEISTPSNLDEIPHLCEELHIDYLNSEFSLSRKVLTKKISKKNLLERGAVYTPMELVHTITLRTLKNVKTKSPNDLKILDFATGTGRFYREIVRCANELWKLNPDFTIINNIYAIDIDPIAINICRLTAFSLIEEKTLDNLSKISHNIICKDALMEAEKSSSSMKSKYPKEFDAIVSNPPYLVLKPNSNKMDNDTAQNILSMVKYFRTSGLYQHSIEGMLNLYQISVEAMIGLLKDGGELGVICPSTLFADISATKLRKYLLSSHEVSFIKYFSEDEQLFFNVTQATCIFHLKKNGTTSTIEIELGDKTYSILFNDVKRLMPSNWEIPSVGKIEWQILKKLSAIPKLHQLSQIRNRRGELDLTLYKDYITHDLSPYRLVRGNMISIDGIKDINKEYVLPSFIYKKGTDFMKNDFGRKRLVCQQISNQGRKSRLHFVVCEPTDILGNSCNYLSVKQEDIEPLKCILNSALLNWRFNITSTNNHINNYELDELPIIDYSHVDVSIIQLDNKKRDEWICQEYGLSKVETEFILSYYYEAI